MKSEVERVSGIELLKILFMFAIIFAHTFNISVIKDGYFGEFVLLQGGNLGAIGNDIFFISSSWFLLDNDSINIEKVFKLYINCFVISIISLCIGILFCDEPGFSDIIKMIFPIAYSKNWFITCYICLYIIHPVLNLFVKSIKSILLLKVDLLLLTIYFLIVFFARLDIYYSTPLVGAIGIYLMTAYVKKYMFEFQNSIKKEVTVLISCLVGNGLFCFLFLSLGNLNDIFRQILYSCGDFRNIFVVFISLSLFLLFNHLKFENRIVNSISAYSLLIYIIHTNDYFAYYILQPLARYNVNVQSSYRFLYFLILTIVIFIVCLIISFIYKHTLQKLLYKWIIPLISRGFNYINQLVNVLESKNINDEN